MKLFFSLVIILTTFQLRAAVPTVEGLFRNGYNKEPAGDFIVYKFSVKESSNKEKTWDMGMPTQAQTPKEKFFKIIISLAKEGSPQMLVASYGGGEMNANQLEEAVYIENIKSDFLQKNGLEKTILYGIFQSQLVNDTDLISSAFKKIDKNYMTNTEILNKDKVELLNSYKNYLVAIKEEEKKENKEEKSPDAETPVSPLKPENEEEKEKVSALMKTNMYQDTGVVKLFQKNKEFRWLVALENISAEFSTDKHQLQKMEVRTPSGNIKYEMHNYILFDGIHELPKYMIMKDLEERMFTIQSLSLVHFNNRGKSLKERFSGYQDILKKIDSQKKPEDKVEKDKTFEFVVPTN